MLELNQQRHQEIKKIQQSLAANKATGAQAVKKQSYENDRRKQEILHDYMAKNQEKKMVVRVQEDAGQQKVQALKQKRLQDFKQNYQARLQEEMDRIRKKELELAKMEKVETELITKLQNTQQLQKRAFGELESAIKYQGSPGKTSPKSSGGSSPSFSKEPKPGSPPSAAAAAAPTPSPAPAPAPAPGPAAASGGTPAPAPAQAPKTKG